MTPLTDRPFLKKNIFQLQKLARRMTRLIHLANKPRFETETEASAARRAKRTIRAQGAAHVLPWLTSEIQIRTEQGPLRNATPLKQQRKLGLLTAIT